MKQTRYYVQVHAKSGTTLRGGKRVLTSSYFADSQAARDHAYSMSFQPNVAKVETWERHGTTRRMLTRVYVNG